MTSMGRIRLGLRLGGATLFCCWDASSMLVMLDSWLLCLGATGGDSVLGAIGGASTAAHGRGNGGSTLSTASSSSTDGAPNTAPAPGRYRLLAGAPPKTSSDRRCERPGGPEGFSHVPVEGLNLPRPRDVPPAGGGPLRSSGLLEDEEEGSGVGMVLPPADWGKSPSA